MSKPLSKKKASMLNMALMGAYQIVTALFGFVLPSMILNTYGASLHGYTTTVSNIMSYVALVNAGLAPAAVQALYAPLAKKDTYRSSLTFRLQRSDGSEVEKLHTAWTQKGRKFLYHTLKRRGVLPLAEQGG